MDFWTPPRFLTIFSDFGPIFCDGFFSKASQTELASSSTPSARKKESFADTDSVSALASQAFASLAVSH